MIVYVATISCEDGFVFSYAFSSLADALGLCSREEPYLDSPVSCFVVRRQEV